MFLEEFKNSLLYAKLPSHWATEAAVAVVTVAVAAGAFVLLDVSDRRVLVVGAVGAAWFGVRIAIIAVRRRSRPMGPGRLD